MIIGISGKAGTGKDTVGKIIQYLIANNIEDIKQNEGTFHPSSEEDFTAFLKCDGYSHSGWKIVKFADALKDIVCILTGCTREQLEDIDFKNSKLPDEWIRYGKADGFIKKYIGNGDMGEPIMNNKQCTKEEYEEELKTNWQTAYKVHPTYRELLQYIGTDLLRNQLHEDTWVNALMSKYDNDGNLLYDKYNWIITDVRFPNEADAIRTRGGIILRVNRNDYIFNKEGKRIIPTKEYQNVMVSDHLSETALDDYTFDYVIDNDGSIEDLITKVKSILLTEKPI